MLLVSREDMDVWDAHAHRTFLASSLSVYMTKFTVLQNNLC